MTQLDKDGELSSLLVDGKGVDENKLRPRQMKGGTYGYEISYNGLQKLTESLESYITSQVSAQAGKMELYGRLHELIELFQHGNITAERYSERHAELTEAISAHPVRPMKGGA